MTIAQIERSIEELNAFGNAKEDDLNIAISRIIEILEHLLQHLEHTKDRVSILEAE